MERYSPIRFKSSANYAIDYPNFPNYSKEQNEQSEQDRIESIKKLVKNYPPYNPINENEKKDINTIVQHAISSIDLASRAYIANDKDVVNAIMFLTLQ